MITNVDIIRVSRECRNIPFLHCGRTLTGVDCVGLIIYVCNQLNIPVIDDIRYSRNSRNLILDAFQKQLIECDNKEIGNIAIFNIARIPQHCGILTDYEDRLGLIHAFESVEKVREHELVSWWDRKIHSLYKIPGVTYI